MAPMKNWENSIKLILPPLAVNVFQYVPEIAEENEDINHSSEEDDDIDKLYTETGGGD